MIENANWLKSVTKMVSFTLSKTNARESQINSADTTVTEVSSLNVLNDALSGVYCRMVLKRIHFQRNLFTFATLTDKMRVKLASKNSSSDLLETSDNHDVLRSSEP